MGVFCPRGNKDGGEPSVAFAFVSASKSVCVCALRSAKGRQPCILRGAAVCGAFAPLPFVLRGGAVRFRSVFGFHLAAEVIGDAGVKGAGAVFRLSPRSVPLLLWKSVWALSAQSGAAGCSSGFAQCVVGRSVPLRRYAAAEPKGRCCGWCGSRMYAAHRYAL